jgi:hypothetical protein
VYPLKRPGQVNNVICRAFHRIRVFDGRYSGDPAEIEAKIILGPRLELRKCTVKLGNLTACGAT